MLDNDECELDGQKVKYIVLEYIDGYELFDLICHQPFAAPLALHLFRKMFLTIKSIHRNMIVHRDIKPDNFMVKRDGSVVLIDFGLASPLKGKYNDCLFYHERCGTDGFMAPEVVY